MCYTMSTATEHKCEHKREHNVLQIVYTEIDIDIDKDIDIEIYIYNLYLIFI